MQHEQGIDWDLIAIPEVETACQSAARGVVRQYGDIMEYGDALQEAYIVAATQPVKVREYLDNEEYGYLNRFVWQRVTDIVRGRSRKQNRDVSWEQLAAQFADAEA